MDENKNFDNLEETTEEAVETNEEIVEEAIEEVETEQTAAEVEPQADAIEIAEPEEIKKGSKIGVVIAVAAAVIVIAAAIITSMMETNKYNKLGYIDISGKTVQDIIDAQGMELSEFLEMYSLPADMPADTTESAAYYTIPTKKIAEMYGMDFDTLKTSLNIPDTVTEDTTWGEAEGEIALADYVGEDNLASFKEQYGLGDEVTGETKWKEIRTIVDTKQKEAREAQEAAEAAAAEADTEDGADEADDAAAGDAAADDAANETTAE